MPPDKGPILGSATITGLDLRALAANTPYFDGVKDMPVLASASTEFRVESGGKLSFAAFDITAHGEVPYAALKTKALHINNLRLVGRYDGVARHLALSTADLDAREARAALKIHPTDETALYQEIMARRRLGDTSDVQKLVRQFTELHKKNAQEQSQSRRYVLQDEVTH